ncbi:MAG: hypothetical protein WAM04_11655 [Candidatus Sulfotelmatobacter sp.]
MLSKLSPPQILSAAGTKLGCDRAECGACTVLIDDIPYYFCSVLTHTVRGRKVLTIEGLAGADGTLHPVQQGVDGSKVPHQDSSADSGAGAHNTKRAS